jgi:hypothetical protein
VLGDHHETGDADPKPSEAAPARSETQPGGWNQGRVTAIAEAFADEVEELRREAKKIPDDISFSQQRAQYSMREDIRLLENSSRRLANQLKAGKGREETLPIFKRMEQLRADAEENARWTDLPEPFIAQIFDTGDHLLQLQPYYREEAR